MELKNQKIGKCIMGYYGLILYFKYNEYLIYLMFFFNWRYIGRGVFEFINFFNYFYVNYIL